MDKIRLQKYFTDCGVLSRRAAEAEIAAGRVTVNGSVAALGDKITPGVDVVLWMDRPVTGGARETGHTYIMLNKPSGYVTTLSDEKERPCVTDLIRDIPGRVYPVGRLDMYSEGLLLLTDDGALTNRLTHPSHRIPKIYTVACKGTVTEAELARLTAPMTLDGYRLQPVEATLLRSGVPDRLGQPYSVIRFTLYEGRNRQIRKMCDAVGLTVLRLRRTAVGKIVLGDLLPGQWRYLTEEEINYLKEA